MAPFSVNGGKAALSMGCMCELFVMVLFKNDVKRWWEYTDEWFIELFEYALNFNVKSLWVWMNK